MGFGKCKMLCKFLSLSIVDAWYLNKIKGKQHNIARKGLHHWYVQTHQKLNPHFWSTGFADQQAILQTYPKTENFQRNYASVSGKRRTAGKTSKLALG